MSERDEFESIRGDLMMVIEYCETQTYIERGSAMWDGLANLKRYAAARAPQAVPDGWKLVPAEPTMGMVGAGNKFSYAGLIYKAMLAAAPQPSQEPRKYQD